MILLIILVSEENKQVESMWGVPMATPTSGSEAELQAVRYLLKIILSPKIDYCNFW